MVKAKHLIALVLVIVGTNLFTFATTRYWTTKHVLTRAQEGLYDQFYPSDRPGSARLILAIPLAGGLSYWWNDGLIFWGAAVLLTLSGLAVTRYDPSPKHYEKRA